MLFAYRACQRGCINDCIHTDGEDVDTYKNQLTPKEIVNNRSIKGEYLLVVILMLNPLSVLMDS